MDNVILRKRLNTFKSEKGVLTNVSNEVTMEVLRAWENWPGPSAVLYRDLGLSKMQMTAMIKKGKRLVKSGVLVEGDFREVALAATGSVGSEAGGAPCAIEIAWEQGKVIRFAAVDQLVDFLKKVA
jgi:hypothetical protein